MGIYKKYVLPGLIDWACRSETSKEQREKLIPLATGQVLEIGIGSGNTLLLYDGAKVKHLTALDPMVELWERRRTDLSELEFEVNYIRGVAEHIPAEDNTFDTVVSTYTLCSVGQVESALKEMHRVIKPGGKLVFAEHGKAPDQGLERKQNFINPVWKRIGGGCNLNRDIPLLMEHNGFKLDGLNEGYLDGWRPTSYNFWGWASKV
ncbi:MAG: class I SAM-dependent methyltransferase [Bacteroidota bacterium]